MIPKYLSETWAALAPGLGDHLWQSTLFAMAAGLLTLVLRNNQACARYWLWMVASLKFLIPFSLFVRIGTRFASMWSAAATNADLYYVINRVSQPFTRPVAPASFPGSCSTVSAGQIHLLPGVLTALWFGGFLAVLSSWYVRWRKVSAVARDAMLLHEGREVEALRRIERRAGVRKPIRILLSRASLEPGIFGITRPVLLWPEGISEQLADTHLEAIVAHEVWHVRRRDNLAAAMHMLVEAAFWFHPLLWWLGGRLLDERERACDEQVLELGSEPHIYAESILKTCEFCLRPPLACASGVTGADLNKRLAHIMIQPVVCRLDFCKKLLLGAAGLVAVAVPLTIGLLSASSDRAELRAENRTHRAPLFVPPRVSHEDPANRVIVPAAANAPSRKRACSKSARAHNPVLSVKVDFTRSR